MAQDSSCITRSPFMTSESTSTNSSHSTTQQISVDPLSSDPTGPADDALPEVSSIYIIPGPMPMGPVASGGKWVARPVAPQPLMVQWWQG